MAESRFLSAIFVLLVQGEGRRNLCKSDFGGIGRWLLRQWNFPFTLGQKVTITVRGEVFTVLVRGWRQGQYVLLDLPRVGVEDFKIPPQIGIQVHFTKVGLFVSFKTTSILSFVQAISFLVIEYPRSFDSHNLRKHERFKANFPLRYHYEEDGQKIEGSGIVRDISESGLLFSLTLSRFLKRINYV